MKEEDIEERIFVNACDEINFRLNWFWLSEDIFFFEYSDGSDKRQWNSDSKDLLNKVFRRRIIIKYRKTERRKYTKLKREFSVPDKDDRMKSNHNNPIFLNIPT